MVFPSPIGTKSEERRLKKLYRTAHSYDIDIRRRVLTSVKQPTDGALCGAV
jgi:hypothetical protein